MSRIRATARGLLIVAPLVVGTVWIPDRVASITTIRSSNRPLPGYGPGCRPGHWTPNAAGPRRRGIV